MTNKYTAHIPSEQYGFIEIEGENRDDVIQEYFAIKSIFEDREGHNQNEWAKIRRNFLNTGELSVEDFENCNKAQRYFINEVKKYNRE